ncbi:hypothetical protein HYY75_11425 [bacterium]|nr:hypothetical protein [bacterium]
MNRKQNGLVFKTSGRNFIVIFSLLPFIFFAGCGGGGASSKSGGGAFEANLVSVKMSQEGSSNLDGVFASLSGSGVTGGWIENTTGVRITGSDLQYENYLARFQTLVSANSGSFNSGVYTLKYTDGGETRDYKSKILDWTIVPSFTAAPIFDYNEQSRNLRIAAQNLPGAKFRLEIYRSSTGSLIRETSEFPSGNITEFVQEKGTLRILLVANVYESGSLRSKAIHVFRDRDF